LNERVIKCLRFFGLNRTIGYGVLARAWSFIAGPVTILIIASRFSKEQQGFYYTFSSLLALQIFFELGLVYVLAQFTSHEFVHLTWGIQGRIEGESAAKERVFDLLCKAIRWFGLAAFMLIVVLVPIGYIFLNQQHGTTTGFAWRIPWALAVFGTAMNLLIVPFYAVIMGSGDVVTVNYREMLGAIISSFIAWTVIGLHGGLYAVFAINCGTFIVSCTYLLRQKSELLKLAWKGVIGTNKYFPSEGKISWWNEVWPIQWKIAISWISGYFIFQLFNPVLFHYHGAVVAGRMGMTLSVSNALLTACSTWMNSLSPKFGKFIAIKDWQSLDIDFYRGLWQSIVVVILGALVGWQAIGFLQKNFQIGQRFIPANEAAILFAAVCVQIIINALGIYVRAHKQEPFMPLAITVALIQAITTWFLGKNYSSLGVVSGLFIVNLFIALPCVYLIWSRYRKINH
jgi:hypothetical protein